jgi:DNA-binding beta-propeller fold protein YncE
MSQDFVTRLETQLTAAEARLERGGRLARLQARNRTWVPSPGMALRTAVAACAAVAVAVGVVALTRGGGERVATGPAPRVVARIPTGVVVDMAPGFGQMWIDSSGRLLKVDMATRRIVARIPVGHFVTGVAVAGGSVWTVSDSTGTSATISRIDPATDRVTAHLRLTGTDHGLSAFNGLTALQATGRDLWVLGYLGGIRIDLAHAAVAGRVRWGFGGGVFASRLAVAGDDLWVAAGDGRLLLIDAHTGARQAQLTRPPGTTGLVALGHGEVIEARHDGTVTRLDARGRQIWTAQLGGPEPTSDADRGVAVADGAVWALRQNTGQDAERLTKIDLASGRTLGRTVIGGIEFDWLTPARGALWFGADTQTAVLRP